MTCIWQKALRPFAIEMEDAIKNCNRQLSTIEQILPTLATKVIAETVAAHSVQLDAITFAVRNLTERLGADSDTLTSLVERLERKGVIQSSQNR